MRETVKRALELHGFRALTAGDGATAVALYMEQREEIRCVITDMMLPHMNGAAIIRVLRKLDPHLKIIAMSGLLSNGYAAEASGLGAQAFLTKPFAADVLARTLIDVLRSDH